MSNNTELEFSEEVIRKIFGYEDAEGNQSNA
jgi:hypothetical protein